MINQALSFICLVACLLGEYNCNALTLHQYNNKLGYHSVSCQHIKLQNHASTSNKQIESSSTEEPNIIHQRLHGIRINRVKKNKICNTNIIGYHTLVSYAEINYDKRRATKAATNMHNNLMHSIALVATCRRLSFLILSITIVNFTKSTILKASTVIGQSNDDDIDILISNSYNSNPQIPKQQGGMFDECPWPFTLFHDPIKFVKTGATYVVLLWVAMSQIYSRYSKARAIIP